MRIASLALFASATAFVAATAASLGAAPVNLAAVMHERHEGMETIGKQFKALHREFDSSSPNIASVRSSAATIANLARRASGWFPAGTGPERGKTGAKPEIWQPQNKADFSAKLAAFQHSAQAFAGVSRGTDAPAMKAAYADLAGTCKACHDKYRMDMHH